MRIHERIKLFGMSHKMVERDLDQIESRLGVEFARTAHEPEDRDERFYPQFDADVRREASSMAEHYELFYCLEKSIRSIIRDVLEHNFGAHWWASVVPDLIKQEVNKNIQREKDVAVTARSEQEIDYTTFGQLGDIVRHNWLAFGDTFNSQKGFSRVMASLNILRGPIAHCSPLAATEVARLRTTLEDWFRLMA